MKIQEIGIKYLQVVMFLKTAKEETAKMYNSYTAPLEEVVDETEENPVKKQ